MGYCANFNAFVEKRKKFIASATRLVVSKGRARGLAGASALLQIVVGASTYMMTKKDKQLWGNLRELHLCLVL